MSFTKTVDLSGREYLEAGEHRIVPLSYSKEYDAFELDSRLTKTAASEDALAFAAKIQPVPGKRVLLVSALGDYESWGDNKKADAFPYNGLQGLHPSDRKPEVFAKYAHRLPKVWGRVCFPTKFDASGNPIGGANTFHEHNNRFPKTMLGSPVFDQHGNMKRGDTRRGFILAEFWNEKMRRVELIQEVWEQPMPHMIKAIDEGFLPGISMACDVPFDRCSICDHLAISESDRCEHLLMSNRQRGVVTSSGVPIVMLTDYPDFFDSSLVQSKAAGEAGTLKKVASIYHFGTAQQERQIEDLSAGLRNLKGQFDQYRTLQNQRLNEVPFSEKVANALQEFPLSKTVAYLGALGIYPTGEDFANIMFGKQANNRTIGQAADKYLLGILGNKVKLASTVKDFKVPLTDNTVLTEEEFEKVASLVSSYIPVKSHIPPFRDYNDMSSRGGLINIETPFNQMDEQTKAIILAKIFTDRGLHQAVQQLLSSPSISKGLDQLGLDAIYSNSKKYLPVYEGLSQDYNNTGGLNARRFETYY